jgi:hypothetical protein
MQPCEGNGPSSSSKLEAVLFLVCLKLTFIHRGDLTVPQREEYIAAVQCLMKLPAKAPKDKYPGALSRYDDFVAYHITHAPMLHDTIHLFPAHKQFLLIYEQTLRTECGYTGYQPVSYALKLQRANCNVSGICDSDLFSGST